MPPQTFEAAVVLANPLGPPTVGWVVAIERSRVQRAGNDTCGGVSSAR